MPTGPEGTPLVQADRGFLLCLLSHQSVCHPNEDGDLEMMNRNNVDPRLRRDDKKSIREKKYSNNKKDRGNML